jgi:hypothetical protein
LVAAFLSLVAVDSRHGECGGSDGSVVMMNSDGEEDEDDKDIPMVDEGPIAAIDEMNPEDLY